MAQQWNHGDPDSSNTLACLVPWPLCQVFCSPLHLCHPFPWVAIIWDSSAISVSGLTLFPPLPELSTILLPAAFSPILTLSSLILPPLFPDHSLAFVRFNPITLSLGHILYSYFLVFSHFIYDLGWATTRLSLDSPGKAKAYVLILEVRTRGENESEAEKERKEIQSGMLSSWPQPHKNPSWLLGHAGSL